MTDPLQGTVPLEQARNAPRIISAVDLMAMELPEPKFIVPNLVTEGINLLAGKPKIGKSWMALHIGKAVAAGGLALGTIEVEPGRVLYLALEDNERRLQARLKTVLQGAEVPDGLDLSTQWERVDQGGLDRLRVWLDGHDDAKLVVIDTLAKVRPNRDSRKQLYDTDYESVEGLAAIANEFSVGVMLIHHLRKGASDDPLDEVSGSTGLTGAVDTILVLKRERSRADAVLFVTGRDVNESENALEFDDETAAWILLGDADEYRQSKERGDIMHAVRDYGAMRVKEVASELEKNVNTIKTLMQRMERDDMLVNNNGVYSIPIK